MQIVPGKVRFALAAIVMCLGLTMVSGVSAEAKSRSSFGIFIGPGYGHHFNHYYDMEYGGFPYYRFDNPRFTTSYYGLPWFSRGYIGHRMGFRNAYYTNRPSFFGNHRNKRMRYRENR